MGRTERARRLLVVERVLLAAAIAALGWYVAVHVVARLDQASQDGALEAIRVESETTKAAPAAASAPLPPRALVGRLEIPRLGMKTIVREGVDSGTLRRAVGHVPET